MGGIRNAVVLLAVTLLSGDVCAAQTWSKTYGTPRWESGYISTVLDGSDLITGYDVTGTRELPTLGYDSFLMRLDEDGGIVWQKGYHVDSVDLRPFSFSPTPDGDWYTFGAALFPPAGGYEVLVAKVDAAGDILWSNSYGDSNDDIGVVSILSDGGLLVDIDKDLSPTMGMIGLWLLRLDANGNIQWQKAYNGPGTDSGTAWEIVGDGFFVGGRTSSFGAGGTDGWALKLDAQGAVEWQKAIGSAQEDFLQGAPLWDDDGGSPGGYYLSGLSFFGGPGGTDTVLVKLDPSGNIEWQNIYGGTLGDNLGLVWEYDQNGSLAGYFLHGTIQVGPQDLDILLARLDLAGDIVWSRRIGGSAMDSGGIRRAENGELYMIGTTESYGAGGMDLWLMKLDESGNIQWQKTYGGPRDENVTADFLYDAGGALAGFIVWGITDSFGGGGYDVFGMRLDAAGNIVWQHAYGGPGLDFGSFRFSSDGTLALAGTTESFGAGSDDLWLTRLDAQGRIEDPTCPLFFDTTAVALDSNATVTTDYLMAVAAGMISTDTTVVPAETSVAPGPLAMQVTNPQLVEETACSSSTEVGPINNLRLRRNGDDVILTWDPSANPDHASYRVRGATTAVPSGPPGAFPTDPVFTDITGSDVDGSATNESWTESLLIPYGFFLVTDINSTGQEGPAEHYP